MSVVERSEGFAGLVVRKRRGRRSRAEVAGELARFRESGLLPGEYARRSDVSEATLRRWLARESADEAGGFAPVRVAAAMRSPDAGLRLRAGGFEVQVGSDTDPHWVAAVLRALAEPC